MNSGFKTLLLWIALGLGIYLFIEVTKQYQSFVAPIDYSEFQKDLKAKKIKSVTINGNMIEGDREAEDGKIGKFVTIGPPVVDTQFMDNLMKSDVKVYKFKPPRDDSLWQLFLSWGPMIVLVVLFLMMIRNMQMGGGKAMSFGKSRARLMKEEEKGKVTFKDVAGIPEAKEELQEIVEFLKDPKKFQKLGGRIPKGVLLMGAPGTGKTLIAKAIAGEANVPFFSISGSDFVEMFVGVGASRVRDLFMQARKAAPCLIFIDEIDAVGRHRGAGLGGGHDEREQTLNALLVEMDGFEGKEGVIILASTNRPDVLDPALLRAGRFDRRVVVPRPELKGREEILRVHTQKLKLSPDVDLVVIARGTPGFVGADLENICNEAALLAARTNKDQIEMSDFEKAKDKVMMGAERRSLVLNDKEKKITAIHEAGHTLVARMIPGTDPVHKVTIIPRGMALGLTMQLPEEDRHNMTAQEAINMITVLFGGRAAEELLCQDITTGAGNDIERATELARRMVTEWGMSKIGPVALHKKEEHVFLGKEIGTGREFSEKTAIDIDEEIKRILIENHQRAKSILKENIEKLKKVSDALLERETLDGIQIDTLLTGGVLMPVAFALETKS
ncbi:MAG: rane protease FtsH catalytic subunit [Bacteriovoracaceae bacterium]|nr:rane protease FtsH catalytic subunit [Bacteriovoracaceae bacterium]